MEATLIERPRITPKEIRLQARREKNNRSLFEFMRYFWPQVSSDEFKSNWHIEKVLCLELEKEAYRVARGLPREYDLIINVPPGTTKTITCSIMFPAWCWTKWFWMRFITASYSAALSLESAEYSRNLIMSDAFKEVYPELEIKEDKSAKGNFKVVKKEFIYAGRMPRMVLGGNRFSTSVGATVTGFHGHINIWDDPINPEQAVSEKELETANRWLDQTLSMRKCDKKVTAMIGIMQRLHQYDPTGHTLAKKGKKVRHICLPGEIRNYREQLNPPELAEYYQDDLLDPVRLSWKVLQDAEMDLGQYGYAGQIGQNPTPPGGGMFKVKNFIIADTLPSKVNFIMTIRYWDKAGTEGGGAYTVGVKMSQLTNDRWVVHDVVRGQWSSEVREEVITTTAVADGPNVLQYVEQEGGSGGKESAEATIVRLSRVGIACRVDHPTGSKELRADTYSVQVNRGRVILHKGEWNTAYIEELRYFPFGTYKDQVDASSGAYNMLTGKRVARRIV